MESRLGAFGPRPTPSSAFIILEWRVTPPPTAALGITGTAGSGGSCRTAPARATIGTRLTRKTCRAATEGWSGVLAATTERAKVASGKERFGTKPVRWSGGGGRGR